MILNILKQLWSIVVGTPIQGIEIDKYPREFINFANYSKEVQEEIGNFEENCLISGMAVKKAFADKLFEIPKLFRIGLGLVLRGRP